MYYSYSLNSAVGGKVYVPRTDGLTMNAVGDLDTDGNVVTFWVNDLWIDVKKNGDGY